MNIPAPEPLDPLLTPEDVAALLRLSVGTVYNWASQRKIQSEKVGRHLRFRRSVVEAAIKTREAV